MGTRTGFARECGPFWDPFHSVRLASSRRTIYHDNRLLSLIEECVDACFYTSLVDLSLRRRRKEDALEVD